MRSGWSAFKARASNRLARHFFAAPLSLPDSGAMVSFTFDDVPDSAANLGAPLIEDYGGRATFYIAGGVLNQWSGHWNNIDARGIAALHRRGHEIACHTFSHKRAIEFDAAAMTAEIERNRCFLQGVDASIRPQNFAYPYGLASIARKAQLARTFRSSRGILPGVNCGTIDLQFLRATPLISAHIDEDGVGRALDEAVAREGWLIFYGHDIAASPSPYGCTQELLRQALEAATRRKIPIVTVAEALRRAGA